MSPKCSEDRRRGAVPDLAWVDEFIDRVRPYIFVRTEDNLLIKRPNQVVKLNPQGARLLSVLLQGVPIGRLLEKVGRDPDKARDIALFLFDVKRYLEGTLNEFNRTDAVEIEPFQMRFSELPIISEIALTYRCNLRCSYVLGHRLSANVGLL